MTVIIYGITNCGTMKKARAWLDARGVAYTFHDYAASGVTRAQLARWAGEVGWERLCNRAGTTFRKLPEAETRDLAEAKAFDLMGANPSRVRPLRLGGPAARFAAARARPVDTARADCRISA